MFMPEYFDCRMFFSWMVYGWLAPLLGTEPCVMESPIARIRSSPICAARACTDVMQLHPSRKTASIEAAACLCCILKTIAVALHRSRKDTDVRPRVTESAKDLYFHQQRMRVDVAGCQRLLGWICAFALRITAKSTSTTVYYVKCCIPLER